MNDDNRRVVPPNNCVEERGISEAKDESSAGGATSNDGLGVITADAMLDWMESHNCKLHARRRGWPYELSWLFAKSTKDETLFMTGGRSLRECVGKAMRHEAIMTPNNVMSGRAVLHDSGET